MTERKMKINGNGSMLSPVPFQMNAINTNPTAARKVMGIAFFHMIAGVGADS